MTLIELAHVSRWYGNVVAVNDISMSIGPGVTGLLGPNGAGKSTLLHLIAGFLPPSRGELTVGGAASSTAHSTPISRPGKSARVCAQMAAQPPALTIVPRYSSSSGISISSRQAAVKARNLASG